MLFLYIGLIYNVCTCPEAKARVIQDRQSHIQSTIDQSVAWSSTIGKNSPFCNGKIYIFERNYFQIDLFSIYLLHQKKSFNGGDFYELDNGFFYSVN